MCQFAHYAATNRSRNHEAQSEFQSSKKHRLSCLLSALKAGPYFSAEGIETAPTLQTHKGLNAKKPE
jgi:hypothetical protein